MDVSQFLESVEIGKANVLNVREQVLPDGTKAVDMQFGQRVLQPEPPSAKPLLRSPRRAHVFHAVEPFRAYLAANAAASCTVLADVEARRVCAVLDETKETGLEVVSFEAQVHPMLAPWCALLGKSFPVLAFARFCMENRRSIMSANAGNDAMDGRELALVLSQITATSKTVLSRGMGVKSINGVMVETEIKGQRRETLVDLPDTITVCAPVFLGCEPRALLFDLLVFASGDDVCVTISSASLQEAFEDGMLSFVALLEGINGVVGLGRINYQPWEVVNG